MWDRSDPLDHLGTPTGFHWWVDDMAERQLTCVSRASAQ
jgi:hypothetical protein